MTGRVRIKRLLEQGLVGTEVTVAGWARSVRGGKGVAFIALNDGSSLNGIQVVVDAALPRFEEIARLGTGSSLAVTGILTASPAAGQRFELAALSFTIYQNASPDYPLQKKRHSFEYLRTIAHLRPRTLANVPAGYTAPDSRLNANANTRRSLIVFSPGTSGHVISYP